MGSLARCGRSCSVLTSVTKEPHPAQEGRSEGKVGCLGSCGMFWCREPIDAALANELLLIRVLLDARAE
jgi:hypothetical protein